MPIITEQAYTERDTILYALGVGAGADDSELKYVFENDLVAFPTMAVVLGYPGFWQQRPEFGIDWQQILHAEQKVVFHRPIPSSGVVRGVTTVERLEDKGTEKGVVLYAQRLVYDHETGELLATVTQGSFLRGNGGFSEIRESSPRPLSVPERTPDAVIEQPTTLQQAMIYRLSGDYNPLHVDPSVAVRAGLDRPVLHGLCTFGFAARAVVATLCADDEARLRSIGGRFTSMVFPGDTIVTEVWKTSDTTGMFRSRVKERRSVAIDHGLVEFAHIG
jgi:acyl dehydratase